MPKTTIKDYDRRASQRSIVNGTTRLRLDNHEDFNPAVILDLSQTGVLIGVDMELQLHDQFKLMIDARSSQQQSYVIHAEVIRLEKSLGDECYTYGCCIHSIKNL